MINKSILRSPFTIFWLILNFLILFLDKKKILGNAGIDGTVVLVGNFILFVATALSFFVSQRSLGSANPRSSVGSLYGSFMIKFFIIVIAAFVYIMVAKKNLNKPALFICMGLYLVYTVLEVSSLQKLLKQKKNA